MVKPGASTPIKKKTVSACCVDRRNVSKSAEQAIIDRHPELSSDDVYDGPNMAGLVGVIDTDMEERNYLEKKLRELVSKAGVRRIVFVGHAECLVNSVSDGEQGDQIERDVAHFSQVDWTDENGQPVDVEVEGMFLAKTAKKPEDHLVPPYYGWKDNGRH